MGTLELSRCLVRVCPLELLNKLQVRPDKFQLLISEFSWIPIDISTIVVYCWLICLFIPCFPSLAILVSGELSRSVLLLRKLPPVLRAWTCRWYLDHWSYSARLSWESTSDQRSRHGLPWYQCPLPHQTWGFLESLQEYSPNSAFTAPYPQQAD